METKNKTNVVERMRKCHQLEYSFIIDPMGIAGGLALMWDEEVKVEVEFSSGDLIDIYCKDLKCGHAMYISFLHALTNFQERLRLWQALKSSNLPNTLLWLCLRDFNEVLYHWKKIEH